MSANRKLLTEIDRTLKKVEEGVEIFDEIWDKVYSATQQNQKEKYEVDLKKEIKKLQRHRDQIKTWVASSDIKDKRALTEARKLIETKMEQFKVCEKETKTKTYSKEGLARETKVDPHEAAKNSTREWLSEKVDALMLQIDMHEADMEKLTSGRGSNKKHKQEIEALEASIKRHRWHIAKLEQITRLLDNDALQHEQINEIKEDVEYYIDANQEPDFMDAYDETMDIFESLDLGDLPNDEEVTGSSNGLVKSSDAAVPVVDEKSGKKKKKTKGQDDDDDEEPTDTKKAATKKKKGDKTDDKKAAKEDKDDKASDKKKKSEKKATAAAAPVPLTIGRATVAKEAKAPAAPAVPAAKKTPAVPTPVNVVAGPPPSESLANIIAKQQQQQQQQAAAHAQAQQQAAAAAAAQQQQQQQQQQKVPPPPQQQQPQEMAARLREAHASTAPPPASVVAPPVNGAQQQTAAQRLAAAQPPPRLGVPPPLGTQPPTAAAPAYNLPPAVPAPVAPPPSQQQQQQQQAPPPFGSPARAAQVVPGSPLAAAAPVPAAQKSPLVGTPPPLGGTQQAVVAPGMPSVVPPQQPQQQRLYTRRPISSSPFGPGASLDALLDVTEHSSADDTYARLRDAGDAGDSDLQELAASMRTAPRRPDAERPRQYVPRNPYNTPAAFPSAPAAVFDDGRLYDKLTTDTLFFIFYYQQGTYQQYLAARELKKQSWRYHKKYMTWFQRHEEPNLTTDEFEQGTYVYFDYESGWCQRIKADFTFEYNFLEDELVA